MYPSASCPLSSRTRNIRLRRASMTSPSTSSFSSFSFIQSSLSWGEAVAAPCVYTRAATTLNSSRRDGDDVRRLGALLTLPRLELDARTLGKALEPITSDVAEVSEEILRALVRGDEAVPLAVVEPLNGSSCHRKHLPYQNSRTGKE